MTRRQRNGALVVSMLVASMLVASGCSGIGARLGGPVRQEPSVPALASFEVVGHRGARGLLPENTLPGFERAIELGASAIELDVGMTRDGVVVVSHDRRINPRICRHADGRSIGDAPGPALRTLSFSETRQLDCGSLNPDPARFPEPPRRAAPGARMPALAEVLALGAAAPAVRFIVEIKATPDGKDTAELSEFVRAVVDVLRAHDMIARATLQSFHWESLRVAKRVEPALRTAALLSSRTLEPSWLAGLDPGRPPDTIGLLVSASPFIDEYAPHWRLLLADVGRDPSHLAEVRAAGFRVMPWTVNDRATMRLLIELGVDGIITDYPDRLVDELRDARAAGAAQSSSGADSAPSASSQRTRSAFPELRATSSGVDRSQSGIQFGSAPRSNRYSAESLRPAKHAFQKE